MKKQYYYEVVFLKTDPNNHNNAVFTREGYIKNGEKFYKNSDEIPTEMQWIEKSDAIRQGFVS